MNMHTWRELINQPIQEQFMSHKLLQPYEQEWTWELAIVESTIINDIHQRLSDTDALVLQTLLKGALVVPTREEQLIVYIKQQLHISGQQAYYSLLSLAELGIVQCRKQPWQGNVWRMPFPIFHHWRCQIKYSSYWSIQSQVTYSNFTLNVNNEIPLGKTLMHILIAMTQLDLSYTKKGSLSKGTIDKLMLCCNKLNNEYFTNQSSSILEHQYATVLTFIFELGYALQLIDRHENGLSLDMERISNWLMLHEWQREALQMQWLCENYLTQPKFVNVAAIFSDLLASDTGVWLRGVKPTRSLKDWLSLCRGCGWLASMSSQGSQVEEEDILVFRYSFSYDSTNHLSIQDNGEIIVLPGTSYRQIWLLEMVADLISEQEITIYKLTLSSLMRGISMGYELTHIEQWLKASGGQELPPFVMQLLEAVSSTTSDKWSQTGKRSQLVNIASADQQLPMRIQLAVVLHQLRPIQLWITSSDPSLREPLMEHEERMRQLTNANQMGITTSWIAACRQYHLSTSKQLVQLAIDQQLTLHIKKQDMEFLFNPMRLIELGNDWIMEGVMDRQKSDQLHQIQLNDWQGIRLHLATVS